MLENNQKELILLQDLGLIKQFVNSKRKRRFAIFKCCCGNEFKARIDTNATSCGCKQKENLRTRASIHGMYNSRLYSIYKGMISRCYNKKHHCYDNYGGRGIIICNEWKTNFIAFKEWALNNDYNDNLTIDRKENNKGYSPDNCRWADKFIQNANTRKIRINNTSGYRGVSWHSKLNKWRTRIRIENKEIHIGIFENIIDAAKAYDQYVIDNNLEHTRNF